MNAAAPPESEDSIEPAPWTARVDGLVKALGAIWMMYAKADNEVLNQVMNVGGVLLLIEGMGDILSGKLHFLSGHAGRNIEKLALGVRDQIRKRM